jgi:ankyrin repeat protein
MMSRETLEEYKAVLQVLKLGSVEQLEALASQLADFPEGVDSFLNRRWIINAIHAGSMGTIEWMLSQGVNLAFTDEEGYTPLHCAIEEKNLVVLETLLAAGAPVNLKGI